MSAKACFVLCLIVLVAVSVCGQTSDDLAAQYPVVSAYEVRPGILMTAKYAEGGQVCEIALEKWHYHTPEGMDPSSTIASKLIDQLTEELVPESDRGQAISRWLKNSFVAGGVFHIERDFENVLIVIDGSLLGGDQVVVIHWKQRTCATMEQPAGGSTAAEKGELQ